MYAHILVPVAMDEGHEPTQAIKVAEALLDADGKITVLHVLEDIPVYVSAQIPTAMLAESEEACRKYLDKIAAKVAAPKEAKLIRGRAGSAIVDFAEQTKADCIVMQSHKPGLEDYLIGSTAGRVVRHAPCCVHVLR